MKQEQVAVVARAVVPAAFRRLCVETIHIRKSPVNTPPAAFRRLCVETDSSANEFGFDFQPPSGGCVLKP